MSENRKTTTRQVAPPTAARLCVSIVMGIFWYSLDGAEFMFEESNSRWQAQPGKLK